MVTFVPKKMTTKSVSDEHLETRGDLMNGTQKWWRVRSKLPCRKFFLIDQGHFKYAKRQ